MKKAIITTLIVIMVAALVLTSCAGTANNAASSAAAPATAAASTSAAPSAAASASTALSSAAAAPTASGKTGLTIGMNEFVAGEYAFDIFNKVATSVVEGTGNKLNSVSDQGDINKVQADVENMINAGDDGALWWGVMDPYFAVGPAQFEKANVPFAFFDSSPSTQQLKDQIGAMKNFAGSVEGANATLGDQMAQQALKDGCKEAIVFANQIGSPIAVRADTFKKTFEAGGGKVDEISHVGTTANAHIEATKNLLAAHPGVDCIYGVSVDYALGAYQVTSQMANGKNIKLYSNDITPDSLQYLKDGKIQGLNGAHWTCMYFSTALLINAIDGHRTLDASGKPIWATVTPIVITPKTVDLYQKCFIDQLPFNYNDIKNLLYRNNTNVTAQDFTDAINNYSFESVVKNKLAQGVVTQADVTAAGITLK